MAATSDAVAAALELILAVEPCRLVAYRGDQGAPLIGYGLARYASGLAVCLKDVTSPPVARGEMQAYLRDVIEPCAARLPGWPRMGVRRQAALLAFMQGVGTRIRGDDRCSDLLTALQSGEFDPEALNEVSTQIQRFVTDDLGRVKPHLASRRRQEAELWNSEAGMMTDLRAVSDTFLKRAPIDSRYLSSEGRRAIAKGDVIKIADLTEIPRDAHDWVTLAGEVTPWALYMPHWEQPAPAAPSAPSGPVDWSDFAAPVGRYLTVGEVLCYDARRRPAAGSPAEANLKVLAEEFDRIRAAWGSAIAVTSGYRPEPINSQVGGVPNSRHVSGEALDVCPVNGDLDGFYQWIRRRWSGGLGDGRPRGFIHLDLRGSGRFNARAGVTPAAIWDY